MSRRWRYPRSRRGLFYGPLQQPAPTAPSYIPAFQEPAGRNSRLAGMRSRRGRFFTVTRVVCPPPRQARRSVVRLASVRHGKFFAVPFVGAVPATAAWVPPSLDPARRIPARLTRRGGFYAVPPAGAAPAVAAWIPPLLDPARRAGARPTRRGEFFTIPLVGAAPAVVQLAPGFLRQAARRVVHTGVRRGRFLPVPFVGLAPAASPWVPPVTRARRTAPGPARRGEYLSVPFTRASCPARITSRRTSAPLCRRGRTWRPPWTVIAPAGPGPYIPKLITSPHRPPIRPVRRGVFTEPPWPSVAHSRTTPRPNSGVTIRPATGTTTRPSTGITERPYILT